MAVSAVTGEGLDLLLDAIEKRLGKEKVHGVIRLQATQARQRAILFDMGAVLHETPADDGGWLLELEIVERDFRRFLKREKLPPEILEIPQTKESAVSVT